MQPSSGYYQNPSQKKPTMIKRERIPEKQVLPSDVYQSYADRPYSEVCKQIPSPTRLFWEDSARELCYSARLLPQNPSYAQYPDAAHIIRTKFLENPKTGVWYFNGNFSKNDFKIKFHIKEIDLTAIFGTDNFCPNLTAALELVKELYMHHFFHHENLRLALFTLTEPHIFRMNIAFPRAIPLYNISRKLDLSVDYRRVVCPSAQYVPISILRALAYLHSRNMVHGNICVDSCFVNEKGNVVLSDFKKISYEVPLPRQEDVALSVFNNNRNTIAKSEDIFSLGILMLDYFFATKKFQRRFPSSEKLRPHSNMLQLWSYELDRSEDLVYKIGGTDSQLFDFLNITLRRFNRPTAQFLLEEVEFTAILEPKYQCYKKHFVEVLEKLGFKIPPMYSTRTIQNRWQSINSRRIMNVFRSDSNTSFFEVDASSLVYESKVTDPLRKFIDGAEILVTLKLHYPVYEEPICVDEKFIVGAENTIFALLLNLLNINLTVPSKAYEECMFWNSVNVFPHPYRPWDIFRIRKALLTMLIDMADDAFDGRHILIEGETLTARRDFPLCDRPEKLFRRLEITMKADRRELVDIPRPEPNHPYVI